MIPLGYMYKAVASRDDRLGAPGAAEICSVSGCISEYFCDYIPHWRHNGHWFFDAPRIMEAVARAEGVDLSDMALFYYEAWAEEYDAEAGAWRRFSATQGIPTNVRPPAERRLLGFDVVQYSSGTNAGCSPLSCNGLAATIPVNRYWLFDTLEHAKAAIEAGLFAAGEPGPYRIVAVYAVGGKGD